MKTKSYRKGKLLLRVNLTFATTPGYVCLYRDVLYNNPVINISQNNIFFAYNDCIYYYKNKKILL